MNSFFRRISISAIFSIISILLLPSAFACSYNPNDARSILKCAEKGDSKAQNELGYRYLHGIGFAQSSTEAMRWYTESANAGSEEAQYVLGYLYQRGLGIRRSEPDAVTWYRKAADSGNPNAQYNLATLLISGKDIQKHPEEAFIWYQKAAAQGHVKAANNLGYLYHTGYGTLQNLQEAQHLYQNSATKGLPESQYNLALLGLEYPNLEGIDVQQWLDRAANQGFPPAMARLGQYYAETNPPDYQNAYYWLTLASAFGDFNAKVSKQIVSGYLTEDEMKTIYKRAKQFKTSNSPSKKNSKKFGQSKKKRRSSRNYSYEEY